MSLNQWLYFQQQGNNARLGTLDLGPGVPIKNREEKIKKIIINKNWVIQKWLISRNILYTTFIYKPFSKPRDSSSTTGNNAGETKPCVTLRITLKITHHSHNDFVSTESVSRHTMTYWTMSCASWHQPLGTKRSLVETKIIPLIAVYHGRQGVTDVAHLHNNAIVHTDE